MKQKIIVITGSTGTGKSHLAIELAKIFDAEIINADSFQVYKELNIGINKPSSNMIKGIKHHLIDTISIYDDFDIKIFQDWSTKIINDIFKRNKNVIICGGSNLYIDALIKGYNLDKANSREQINYFDDWEYQKVYDYVLEKDKQEALKIGFNNKKRIIRAAQIIYSTNKKKSEQNNEINKYIYDCFIIQTILDKDELYEKLNNRVDKMLVNGWVEEVKELLKKDPDIINRQAFKAIGYNQIAKALINNQKIDVDYIKQITRNLAKKQVTWCRNKYEHITQFNINDDDIKKLVSAIKKFYNN